jgi:hypothetical protein
MTPQVLLLESLENFSKSKKIPVWVNINETSDFFPGFLIDIEGNNTLIGHIALKEGKECFRHIWIPLKSKSFDYTKVVSGKELHQNSRL